MSTALLLLRATQLGLHIADLEEIDEGMLLDMFVESANDREEYTAKPTQSMMDRF